MNKKIKRAAVVLSLCTLLASGCDVVPEQPSKNQEKHETRVYPVLKIDHVPWGQSISSYLNHEGVEGKISYEGMSKVIRKLNKDNPAAIHSGLEDGIILFRSKKNAPIRAPDYNYDGKIFGVKGILDGRYIVQR